MKRILSIVLLSACVAMSTNAQILVKDDGTIIDQRETTKGSLQTTKNTYKSENKSSSISANKFDPSKLRFGGSFGLAFSNNVTTINISPKVGYQLSNYFLAGAGIGYTYYKDKVYDSNSNSYNRKSHYATFSVFGQVYPIKYLVLSVEPEISRMWETIEQQGGSNSYSENKFVPSVIVGGGFRLGNITVMMKYDVVRNDNSPYGREIFYSIGYSF